MNATEIYRIISEGYREDPEKLGSFTLEYIHSALFQGARLRAIFESARASGAEVEYIEERKWTGTTLYDVRVKGKAKLLKSVVERLIEAGA